MCKGDAISRQPPTVAPMPASWQEKEGAALVNTTTIEKNPCSNLPQLSLTSPRPHHKKCIHSSCTSVSPLRRVDDSYPCPAASRAGIHCPPLVGFRPIKTYSGKYALSPGSPASSRAILINCSNSSIGIFVCSVRG